MPLFKSKRARQAPPGDGHKITDVTIPSNKADLPKLIAAFGTANATSWLEGRYKIWRSPHSTKTEPMVQGYLRSGRYVFAWGNPLCRREDLARCAEEFVEWCEEKKGRRRPVWCCIDRELEQVLREGVRGKSWNTIECIKEDLLHPDHVDLQKKDVKTNRMKAFAAKVVVTEIEVKGPTFLPDDNVKEEVEEGLRAWRDNREGTQIASSALLPWMDGKHRRYFIAKTPDLGIVGICILAPIARNAYQIKNAISFPKAPRGTSEDLLGSVIEQMENEGRRALTFGPSAASEIVPGESMRNGLRMQKMRQVYRYILRKGKLEGRGQFRHKFDTEDEPLYVSFPPGGFGLEGVASLMRMLRT
ncbi:hypothetical protein MNV49_003650 [Pseudohyphozyma bogoriensis]|nr:hypothetical protein MNV49_003650 [Pseudohyphozyma bogoriensis]